MRYFVVSELLFVIYMVILERSFGLEVFRSQVLLNGTNNISEIVYCGGAIICVTNTWILGHADCMRRIHSNSINIITYNGVINTKIMDYKENKNLSIGMVRVYTFFEEKWVAFLPDKKDSQGVFSTMLANGFSTYKSQIPYYGNSTSQLKLTFNFVCKNNFKILPNIPTHLFCFSGKFCSMDYGGPIYSSEKKKLKFKEGVEYEKLVGIFHFLYRENCESSDRPGLAIDVRNPEVYNFICKWGDCSYN